MQAIVPKMSNLSDIPAHVGAFGSDQCLKIINTYHWKYTETIPDVISSDTLKST